MRSLIVIALIWSAHLCAIAQHNHPYDYAIDAMKKHNIGEAVYGLSCVERGHPAEASIARRTLTNYRSSVDLPEPDLFVFDLVYGVGSLAHRVPMQLWFILSLLGWGALVYLLWKKRLRSRWLFILGVCILCSTALTLCRDHYLHRRDVHVVMDRTPLLRSPYDEGAEVIQQLFAGQMVKTTGHDKHFALVQTDTYEEGWVDTAQLRLILQP